MDLGPDYWEQLAEEARAIAAQLSFLPAKLEMLKIASAYVQLARHARRRADRMSETGVPEQE